MTPKNEISGYMLFGIGLGLICVACLFLLFMPGYTFLAHLILLLTGFFVAHTSYAMVRNNLELGDAIQFTLRELRAFIHSLSPFRDHNGDIP